MIHATGDPLLCRETHPGVGGLLENIVISRLFILCGVRRVASSVQGLLKRKNSFPVGGLMVMLLVPLLVVIE